MIEHFFICPYCWQTISMLLDPDMATQEYVEDCEVCCNPIVIVFDLDDRGGVMRFRATKLP